MTFFFTGAKLVKMVHFVHRSYSEVEKEGYGEGDMAVVGEE